MPAKYTEYLRELMRNEHTMAAITSALSTYPLYSTKNQSLKDLIPTRENLNATLLNHYKYREIGFETVGRFLDELEITMCEIMPRYNELFKTVEIMAELPSPFDNVDVVETFEEQTSNTASNQGTSSLSGTVNQTASGNDETNVTESNDITGKVNGKRVEVDTPQNANNIPTKDIDDVIYSSFNEFNESISESGEEKSSKTTNKTSNTSNGSNSSEGSSSETRESNGTTKHTFTKKGNQGVNTYAHDMNEFRTSIIDVVDQIINDPNIAELFMMVY